MKISIVLLAATLVGCATPTPDFTHAHPAAVTAATLTTSDPKFDKFSKFEGPQMRVRYVRDKAWPDRWDDRTVILRSAMGGGVPDVHSAYVDVDYEGSGWRFYQSATVAGGRSVRVVPIQRTPVLCIGVAAICHYKEVFAVPLQESDLRGSGDLEIRLESRLGGAEVVTVPRAYLVGYLTAITAAR